MKKTKLESLQAIYEKWSGKKSKADNETEAIQELYELEPGSGGGVTSWNDLEDRPFYNEVSTVEVLPETQAVNVEEGFFTIENENAISGVEVGGTYNVRYNGAVYKCVAQLVENNTKSFVVLGDVSALDASSESTGEPFAIIIVPSEEFDVAGVAAEVIVKDGATSVTIAIVKVEEIIHPIDPKYLPEGGGSGGGLVRIDITDDDEGLLIASKTYDEISDIILSGALPYCVYYNSVFQLYHSDVIDDMSTYREAPSHKFSSLAVEGTTNSYIRSIRIDNGDSVGYTEHLITITE